MHFELSADYWRILRGHRVLRNERKRDKKEKILFDILRNHALLQKYAGKVMGEKVI